jgi:hypothetical protein
MLQAGYHIHIKKLIVNANQYTSPFFEEALLQNNRNE